MPTLTWTQPIWPHQEWALVNDVEPLAIFKLTNKPTRGADVSHAGGTFRIEARGWFRHRFDVQVADGSSAATMRMGWMGSGEMRLADGRRFTWKPEAFLGRSYVLRDEGESLIATVRVIRGLKTEASVAVEPVSMTPFDVLSLLALAWHATLALRQHGAAASWVPA